MQNLSESLSKYYWLVTEGPRLVLQIADTVTNLKQIPFNIKPGKQNPTILIPGFSASNLSLFFMRNTLNHYGYNSYGWALDRNVGFREENFDIIIEQITKLHKRFNLKVNLVGQSLGGCYARAVANDVPEMINSVVTLGSPINSLESIHKLAIKNYNDTVGIVDAAFIHYDQYHHKFYRNPPVPTTSIYSRRDGVVNWKQSVIAETELSENIEITSGHFGMAFDITTILIIADRISQDVVNWGKYSP